MKTVIEINGVQEGKISFTDLSGATWTPANNLRRDSLRVLDARQRRLSSELPWEKSDETIRFACDHQSGVTRDRLRDRWRSKVDGEILS